VILREEVAHVAAGTRWFHWCCARDGIDPEATFARLLDDYMNGSLRGPFNLDARRAANGSSAPPVTITLPFVRYASHQSQGRANGAKDGPGKRLGAKKSGGIYILSVAVHHPKYTYTCHT
jgi:hypothetical protein